MASRHYTAYIQLGKQAEKEQDPEKAAEYYEQAIKQEPLEEWPYHRLMVIYRKSRNYKEEGRVIDKAIRVFTSYYEEKKEKLFSGNKKLEQTGKALLKSLQDGKIQDQEFLPEPLPGWIKRKKVVEKRAGKKQK